MPDSIIGKFSVGDGATFTPDVTDGVLSFTNNKNLPNPEPYDIAAKVLDEGENDLRDLVTAAQTAAGNAATSETNAHNSELAAAASAGNAATSETNAHNSELAAASSESNAATSEGNAATSATNAHNSELAASDSADEAEAAAELVKKDLPLPIGFEYFTMNPNIPQGSLPLFGGEYDRATYSDLWAWVQTQTGYLKTEAEWQTLSASNNGNVPYYSDGDGSTTFRVPSLKCWVRGANGTVQEVGSYLQAGLPNITGYFDPAIAVGATSALYSLPIDTATGAFSTRNNSTRPYFTRDGTTDGTFDRGMSFDASASNSIYGNANTVQPESIVGMWLVKAYGVIVDTGTIDEQQYIDDRIAAEITRADGKYESVVASGSDYIRYDSGLQMCWGYFTAGASSSVVATFPVPFSSAPRGTVTGVTSAGFVYTTNWSPTSVSAKYSAGSSEYGVRYIAIGYWK